MLNDLAGQGRIAREADFIVIGAGTAGLPTSVALARKTGKTVLCLESGGPHQEEETHPLNEVVQCGMPYKGAAAGRFRCLGGTSTRWGGALIPFQSADLRDAHWPIGLDELSPYIDEVEKLFSLERGPYSDLDFPFFLGSDHVNRLAKWPEFKKRNVAALFDAVDQNSPHQFIFAEDQASVGPLRFVFGAQDLEPLRGDARWPDVVASLERHLGRDGEQHYYSSKPPLMATMLA
ncbi:MAG: hypothetical protein P8Y58_03490, partial [Novosphingobium sp.]